MRVVDGDGEKTAPAREHGEKKEEEGQAFHCGRDGTSKGEEIAECAERGQGRHVGAGFYHKLGKMTIKDDGTTS